jgi:DNA-binding CsgD family transcriptional regulator
MTRTDGTTPCASPWEESVRLGAAARRLRDEIGYRWRFRLEQQALDAALDAARHALGADLAARAEADTAVRPWQDTAARAERARGERKRPRHGWASLTPTEEQVVALVAQGMTNPQIGERLLMGRATVKTHLEHIFAKLGIRSRTELATEALKRGPQSGT